MAHTPLFTASTHGSMRSVHELPFLAFVPNRATSLSHDPKSSGADWFEF